MILNFPSPNLYDPIHPSLNHVTRAGITNVMFWIQRSLYPKKAKGVMKVYKWPRTPLQIRGMIPKNFSSLGSRFGKS